ncbi:major capsid protein [Thauera aromatica]|uniref:major capsid protein n=1 Tax=Thauera aromatica TaxID=59405 RepID=UPI001FFD449B|nr:major capsid protein [Thauera aromatica]MCK2095226.1 major capsid protein [Thauera aromatica]
MPSLNIFQDDAFSLASLTAAVQNVPYQPGRIGQSGIFSEDGINTLDVYVESENGVLQLVPVGQRGTPAKPIAHETRVARSFRVPHLPVDDLLTADSILGVRSFGAESELETVAKVVAKRLAPMRNSLEYTLESHRLAAIMGTYYSAQGAAVSLFDEFGVTQQTVAMALGTDSTKVRARCLELLEKTEDALGGLSFTGVHAYCGKDFWTKLIEHPALKDTVLNTAMAASLREDPRQVVEYGGVTWERYRGTSAVKVPDAEAFAFPVGVPDLFITRFAPADYVETVGTIGQRIYAKQWNTEGDKAIKLEAQMNPLNICTRPRASIKLTTN